MARVLPVTFTVVAFRECRWANVEGPIKRIHEYGPGRCADSYKQKVAYSQLPKLSHFCPTPTTCITGHPLQPLHVHPLVDSYEVLTNAVFT